MTCAAEDRYACTAEDRYAWIAEDRSQTWGSEQDEKGYKHVRRPPAMCKKSFGAQRTWCPTNLLRPAHAPEARCDMVAVSR